MFTFSPAWGYPASPFGVKLLMFLRMTNIPHEISYSNPTGPRGKSPYCELNGEVLTDSALIIERLTKEFNIQLDSSYSATDLSIARAFQKMTEEHMYWCMVWSRWIDPQNWAATKAEYFKTMSILKYVIPGVAATMVGRNLNAQGTGRFTPAEISEKYKRDFQAISEFLGNKQYFLGDTLSTVDATIWAFIVGTIKVPLKSTAKTWAEENAPNLVQYCERMQKQFWDKPQTEGKKDQKEETKEEKKEQQKEETKKETKEEKEEEKEEKEDE